MKQSVKKRLVKKQYSLPRWSSYVIGVLVLLLAALFIWQFSPTLTGKATVTTTDTTSYASLQKTDVGEVLLPTTPIYYIEKEEYSSGVPTGNIISEYTLSYSSDLLATLKGIKKYGIVGYFLSPALALPPGKYQQVPLPVKGTVPLSTMPGERYKDSSVISSAPYGRLEERNGQAEATLQTRGVYEVPTPQYYTSSPAYGYLLGYATTQPTKILPTTILTPTPPTKPTTNYGSLEVYATAFDSSKGRYDVWVVYNEGNVVIKDISFSLRHHKNLIDATVYNYADTRYGLTVAPEQLLKTEDSLLFPGEEIKTSYTTKGTFNVGEYTAGVCTPGSGPVCDFSNPSRKPARAIMLRSADSTPEVQASLKNDPGSKGYDILVVKHGYVLSDVTGVTPEGYRVTIPVKITSMRDA